MDGSEPSPSPGTPIITAGDNSPNKDQNYQLQSEYDSLLAELESLRASYHTLEFKYKEAEDNLVEFQQERDDALKKIVEFEKTVEGLSSERDGLCDWMRRAGEREEDLKRKIDDGMREKEGLEREIYAMVREREELVSKIDVGIREKEDLIREVEVYKKKNVELEDEKRERLESFSRNLESISAIKESMVRIAESLDGERVENVAKKSKELKQNLDSAEKYGESKELSELSLELNVVSRMVEWVEVRLDDNRRKMKEEKSELEDEKGGRVEDLSRSLNSISTLKESLARIIESLDEDKEDNAIEESKDMKEDSISDEKSEESKELNVFLMELNAVLRIAKRVEANLNDYQEKMKKEKREFENSVVSLTEENRDINSLLRIALIEKEAVEKSLNKLKGNNEQKRVALLQIAERGLQRVGFGFMMGAAPSEPSAENTSSNASNVSDSSECEEEVVSLASTLEKIMKNLRLEITQLRRALEESRSDNERLRSLTEKQAQQIAEQTLCIKELEDQETMLTQNVKEFLMEIKATEEEVARWRGACELEVEAGKSIVEERDKVIALLKLELDKTRAALEVSNRKLKVKEELAAVAIAAQEAAERSLQLADSRAAGLHERIEELTRQSEEAENRKQNRKWVRRLCWPWRVLKANAATAASTKVQDVRHLLPEMQALLHTTI
ncbi:hypothetical protein Nepgr_010819 [Nepenthes gracilis]|uniref:ATP binding protein n=1 Tax=Nepenthes gracilis TaxID=150966 RepID=A0AAD3SDN3_NEPGR|nr:hypothetical protein Nepgr_010819 [Nepenthes gracilis]